MTRDELQEKLAETSVRLLDKLNASCDFDKPAEAADYASALKDTIIARREFEDDG